MAAATSPSTGRTYGVKRVCTIWGVARSSFYDARRQDARPPERPTGRPGPKPVLSDVELLAAIRRDLARSPWTGEGHRKVWARLRVIAGIRVGRTRVLRPMGENHLLSPHRRPPRPANHHDGRTPAKSPSGSIRPRRCRRSSRTDHCPDPTLHRRLFARIANPRPNAIGASRPPGLSSLAPIGRRSPCVGRGGSDGAGGNGTLTGRDSVKPGHIRMAYRRPYQRGGPDGTLGFHQGSG